MKQARITGLGSYAPERVLSNSDLEKIVDTTDEWISSRTGMKERRIAASNEASSDMGVKAGKKALDAAGISAEEIDLILVATSTPDHLMPSTAAIVQSGIGAVNAAAFDILAACTGFLYGLSTAKAYIESGMYRNILLIASEKISTVIDYQDRSTCVLFGDGASAAVVSSEGSGFVLECIKLGADGSLSDLIIIPGGGSRLPLTREALNNKMQYFKMSGKEVFRHAVRRMTAAAKECLESANLNESQISWLVPHQANERIIDAIAKSFRIPLERVGKTVHKYGNTSAASVAMTLDEVITENNISNGEHLLLAAFGSGLTWGASVITKIEESRL